MSQRSKTVRYYDNHADEYVKGTISVQMVSLYRPFLELIPAGGRILDAGCGSGPDTKAFLERGFEIVAIDASEKMVEAARQLTGISPCQLLMQEITFQNEFDGVWACASLLHIPRSEIEDVLNRFARALNSNGICYMSFKEGEGDHAQGDRQFTDYTASSLEACLARHPGFQAIDIWLTDDARPSRNERWVNALVKKSEEWM